MTFDIKILAVAVTLSLTIAGVGYKGILKVQQVDTNTKDIRKVEANAKLDKLCKLHRKALSDFFFWDAECKKSNNTDVCRRALEAKSRVDRLEKQIADLEERTGETCG